MNIEIQKMIVALSYTPDILFDFIKDIPKPERKKKRRPGKWSIHENACHLAQAEKMINQRFVLFTEEEQPQFDPYLPGDTVSDDGLMDLDLQAELNSFRELRKYTVAMLRFFNPEDWEKEASHPEYYRYNPKILLRHTLMHDHFHMYRIEELWLTKTEFL